MAELSRVYSLYINGDKPGGLNALLSGKTSSQIIETPAFMQGDRFALRLFFRKPGATLNDASTAYELPATFSLVLSGKLATAIKTGSNLILVSTWTKTGTGDDVYYSGSMDMNTAELTAAFETASADTLSVYVDIEVRDATNSERTTYRVPVTVYRQVYDGQMEPSPLGYPEIVMVSPNGSYWKVGVADTGQVEIVATTTQPAYTSLTMVSPGGTHYGLSVTDAGNVQIVSLE